MDISGYFGGTSLYIPNTFTPNHDGLNDRFLAYGDGIMTFDMKIFNRWGELIFETSDPTWGWDGQYKGTMVENDVYVYVIKFSSLCTGGAQLRQIGHVLVRR
jgi:gliding motility-associated-like protein